MTTTVISLLIFAFILFFLELFADPFNRCFFKYMFSLILVDFSIYFGIILEYVRLTAELEQKRRDP